MSKIDGEIVARAAELADANLFPGALAVDAKGEVPVAALDLVCGAGFHGLFSPTEFGASTAVDVAEGTKTATNVVVTVTSGVKFKVLAIL